MKNRLLIPIIILAIALFGVTFANAQAEPPANAQEGPSSGTQDSSSNAVGRLSLIHGDVSTQRGDSGEWSAAALNAPVVSGDKVSTGERSRAEVQLDDANTLRLGDRSQATIAGLTRNQIQIQLGQGIANFSVFKGGEANVEIDTPNVAIHPSQRDGSFRIEVNANGETQVIVRKGEAEISTPQGSTRLEQGQLATIRGTGDDTQYKIADAPEKDSWDSWNSDRDHMIQSADSWRHTNRYYVGSQDLDAYGHWVDVPDYGPVWSPVVAPGWAPYRAGRWVWEPYYGWTWVSYEPWGWAPYHYGRWMFYGSSWVWWPGPVYGGFYRPVWAPAYVSFFGFGGGVGFGVGFGFGSIGWLPIGPCDRFYPWYGRYGNHFNVVNVTNITRVNVTNIRTVNNFNGVAPLRAGNQYSNLRLAATNANFRSAISTVPSNHFGTGRVAATPVSQQMFNSGRMMTGNLPVVPSRENLSASNRAAAPSTIRGGQQSFFSKSHPMAPQSFDRQAASVQSAIQHNGFTPIRSAASEGVTRTGAMTANNTLAKPSAGTAVQNSTLNRGNSTVAAGASNSVSNNSYRSFGSPIAQNKGTQNPTNNNAASSTVPRPPQVQNVRPQTTTSTGSDQGWRRFSDSTGSQNHNVAQPMNNRSFGSTGPTNTVGSPNRINNNVPRPPQSSTAGSTGSNGNWRTFSSSGNSGQYSNRGGQVNDQWNRFPSHTSTPTMSSPRGSSYYGGGMSGSRPPLNMQKNIVTPRSYGPTSYRGSGSAPHVSSGSSSHNSGNASHGSSGHSGHR
jgi:uncharacterized protein DUF6600/FecR-like protein